MGPATSRPPFDFQAIAGGEEYVVAVPTKVLNELDEKQHEGRRGHRNPARDLVMTFRHVSKGGHTALGRWEGSDQEGLTYWFVGGRQGRAGQLSATDVDRLLSSALSNSSCSSRISPTCYFQD